MYNKNVYYYKLFLRPILPSQNLGCGGRQYYAEDYETLTENSMGGGGSAALKGQSVINTF